MPIFEKVRGQGRHALPLKFPVFMTFKKHLKASIRLIIEADGNPVTIVMRLSRAQVLKVLDLVLPDDVEE